MKYVLIVCIYLLVISGFQSCDYVEGLHKKGNIVETEIWIDEFDVIQVDSPVRLILEQNSGQIARISGLDYKLKNLNIEVQNSILVLESSDQAFARLDQNVTVHLPINDLKEIVLNVPTQLISEDELVLANFRLIINGLGTYSESSLKLKCQSVTVAAFGENSGNHILVGETENLNLTMEGLAWTDASALQASKVFVNQRSLKKTYVSASDQLIVNMYSSGDVYFTGHPELIYQTFKPDWDIVFGLAINNSE